MAFADEVTVLRRGKLAGARQGLRPHARRRWPRMMIGAEELTECSRARTGEVGAAAAGARQARRARRRRRSRRVHDVSLDGPRRRDRRHRRRLRQRPARAGRGAGRPARGRAAARSASHGERYHASARGDAPPQDVAACRRSRCRTPASARMSVAENMAFRDFDRAPLRQRRLVAERAAFRERRRARDRALSRSRPARPTRRSATLSGGNVQRAVLARELGGEVDVLIAANPCFGLDFAAVAEIHAEIMRGAQPRRRGAAGQRGPRRALRACPTASS